MIDRLHVEASYDVLQRAIAGAAHSSAPAAHELMHAALDSHELLVLQYLAERGVAIHEFAVHLRQGKCWRCGIEVLGAVPEHSVWQRAAEGAS